VISDGYGFRRYKNGKRNYLWLLPVTSASSIVSFMMSTILARSRTMPDRFAESDTLKNVFKHKQKIRNQNNRTAAHIDVREGDAGVAADEMARRRHERQHGARDPIADCIRIDALAAIDRAFSDRIELHD
jgi:hypothetical protein